MKMQVKLEIVYDPNKTSVVKLKDFLRKQKGVDLILQISDVTILEKGVSKQ